VSDADATRPPRFLAHVRVRFHDVDALGHVNNAAYLTFLEQAAIDHAALALTLIHISEPTRPEPI
jgi:acyl-CoA thioesterase FadM